jgi:DHA1 family multidrug resistance protein-like MFS transporter
VNNRQALITLCLAGFAGNISFSLLFPALPYYAEEMGASPPQIGLIVASYSYVTAIALIPFGMLSDKVGHLKMLAAGLVIFALAPFLYPLASNLSQLGLVRAFHGLASAIFLPAATALVIETSTQDRWGETLGWFTTATQAALIVGPMLGGLVLNRFGFTIAFGTSGIVPLAGLIFVLFRLTAIQPVGKKEVLSSVSWRWLKPSIFAGLTAPFFFTMGSGTILTFMPLYGQSLGIAETGAGVIIASVYIGSTLLRVPGGKLSDRIGRRSVILMGLATSFTAMILISFLDSFPSLVASAILYGVGMGLAMPASYALVADLASAEARGLSMGMTNTFLHSGIAIGPTVMGIVANVSSYTTMFRTCSLSLILGLIVVFVLTKSRR